VFISIGDYNHTSHPHKCSRKSFFCFLKLFILQGGKKKGEDKDAKEAATDEQQALLDADGSDQNAVEMPPTQAKEEGDDDEDAAGIFITATPGDTPVVDLMNQDMPSTRALGDDLLDLELASTTESPEKNKEKYSAIL
jgi:hypothetical protein